MVKGDPDYMSINLTGCFARKRIDHWATKHPDWLHYWIGLYLKTYFPIDTENSNYNFFSYVFRPHIYTHAPSDAEVNWEFDLSTEGSSSIFGVLVALALGYDPIYLAGIPLDASGSFYDPPGFTTMDYGQYQKNWIPMNKIFDGRVKSYSGFTRELLGSPN